MEGKQELESYGEFIIGTFGTDKEEVAAIKKAATDFINTVTNLVGKRDPRRAAIAVTNIELAQMIAVKGLFSKTKQDNDEARSKG